jgi:hypothetical protein
VIGAGTLPPVIALAAWTMVMWAWMYATRLPAIGAAKVDLDELVRDPATSLDDLLPVGVQWKAHNYNHLHEAPTVFYAVAIVLAMIGAGDGLNAHLAWGYVAIRVIHSVVQATINKVALRFVLFALSSVVLMILVARAVMVMF